VFDENGFNPQFDLSDSLTLEGDVLIITVGQGPDRASLQKEGLLDERGTLAVDPLTLQSMKKEWVFIGGDMRRVGFMAEAMREGLVAAESIERYLRELDIREGRKISFEAQDIPLRRFYLSEPEVLWIPPEKRMHFQLFERGFTLQEAIEEAKRCLTCGPCISCKACVSVGIQESLPTLQMNEERCCGCGICASVCYYGAAQLKETEGKRRSTTDMFKCKSCGMCVVACPSGVRELADSKMGKTIQETYASL
jgi:ferredoxin